MQDANVPAAVSRRMSNTKGRDTAAELAIRKELHRRGFRYYVNRRPEKGLRRTADILFPRVRIAIMIDGCFWHGCPEHYRPASTRSSFWAAKVETNRARDLDTNLRFGEAGWVVLRFWEHETPMAVADHIADAIASIAP